MSFSYTVKKNLSVLLPECSSCLRNELAALISYTGIVKKNNILSSDNEETVSIKISTENVYFIKRVILLLKICFNIDTHYINKNNIYTLEINNIYDIENITDGLGMYINGNITLEINEDIPEFECCKKSLLRGLFLACGYIADPIKNYHVEFISKTEPKAIFIKNILSEFDIIAKVLKRKNVYITYIKESETIAQLLAIIGAHNASLNVYNAQIEKDMRNNVNRFVNCETANLDKTMKAAFEQIDALNILINSSLWNDLSPTLKEIALLRLNNPDMSLKQLGQMLDTPISKSGVNHRLKKLIDLSDTVNPKNI